MVSGIVKKMCFFVLYTYPQNDHHFIRGIQLLEDRLLNLDINIDLYDVLIMGDLNTRTGVENDFVLNEKLVPELEEYRDILNDDCTKRASCDKTVKFGSDLLEFCKMYSVTYP